MNSILRRKALVLLVLMLALQTLPAQPRSAFDMLAPPLPNPVLYLVEIEFFTTGGKEWKRYKYNVENSSAYPNELFAAAPALPPCGKNTSASRTWVDFYDQSGKRLNGFCALGKSESLNGIWFALEATEVPPSWVYIEMNDRQTNTKYKSNLAETTP